MTLDMKAVPLPLILHESSVSVNLPLDPHEPPVNRQ